MKTKKLNLFDVLIIIVIAVIVAGVFFRAEIRSLFFSDESSSFLMDVQITFLENSRASTVKDGLTVYDSDGKELGKITAISKTPSSDTVTIDGVDREVLSTRCSDVTITIMLRGYIADGVYYTRSGRAFAELPDTRCSQGCRFGVIIHKFCKMRYTQFRSFRHLVTLDLQRGI